MTGVRGRGRGRPRVALALAATALVAAACGGRTLPPLDVEAEGEGIAAPLEGDRLVEGGWPLVAAFVRDAAAAGDAVVVNLFASWCAPCADELPLLIEESRRTPGVRWIGVATQDVPRNAEPFVDRFAIPWATTLDLDADTYDALEGVVMPTTAFFDADGRLVRIVDGQVDEATLVEALRTVAP